MKFKLQSLINLVIRNANIVLAITLFAIGILFLSLEKYSTLSGALFGAGAALLGSWTTDISNRYHCV